MKASARPTSSALRELEQIKSSFDAAATERKLALLDRLSDAKQRSAADLLRWHDALCYLRALPDDARVLARVESLLAGFSELPQVRRFARELVNSGIAGCEIAYPFFSATARRLAARYPGRLDVDWDAFERSSVLEERLQLLATYSETPGLDELDWPMKRWVRRLAGPNVTDAEFLIARSERVGRDPAQRDAWYDELGLTLVLRGGQGAPSRTLEKLTGRPVSFQTRPLRRERPDLRRELRRPPVRVVDLDAREGARVVELARDAMTTRQRDLDAFIHGDARDVRLVDCGDGLEFACIGVQPSRRLMFESVYAFLTLKNGSPIGYVLVSALMGSSEIAYNVFDTWRGGEAGHIYGRVLATVRALFGADTFTIYPYQLGGDGNDEGLASGSWWFYAKLGFRARDAGAAALAEVEFERVRADREHRTSRATLKKLAAHNVFWSSGRKRDDVIGVLDLSAVGVAVSDYLAQRFGVDRERGERICADDAARLLGARSWKRWGADERLWWTRWAPLVLALDGVAGWTRSERAAVVEIIRAKAGRRESEFVRRFDEHRKLRAAIRALSATIDVN